ncbi:MAG TPA: hypothetical protein VM582_00255 [Candidatus Thermoplasmatota archaeon]|nr:hypothetical protein [Candidatus Thermoplasmatota archaeon]
MHVQLAPGESLLPDARARLEALFEDARVEAVLLPLVPQGERALPRAARRYLAAWDARLLHPQNFFAPAARVASRAPLAGWRNADAAPALADALAAGRRVEALRESGVATRIADDLGAWTRHFRAQGEAWARLARERPDLARFAPPSWWRHNVAQAGRRVIEALEATRAPDPLVLALHLAREAAYSDVATAGQHSSRPAAG